MNFWGACKYFCVSCGRNLRFRVNSQITLLANTIVNWWWSFARTACIPQPAPVSRITLSRPGVLLSPDRDGRLPPAGALE